MTASFTCYSPTGKKLTATVRGRRNPGITRREARETFEQALTRAVADLERLGWTDIKRVRPVRSRRGRMYL